jgi:hypothetical protein
MQVAKFDDGFGGAWNCLGRRALSSSQHRQTLPPASGWLHLDQGNAIGSCIMDDAGKIRCASSVVMGVALSGCPGRMHVC